ncbi:MAG: hypothetical protein ACRC1M_07415, partial [Methanobacteriaceae archaeon]
MSDNRFNKKNIAIALILGPMLFSAVSATSAATVNISDFSNLNALQSWVNSATAGDTLNFNAQVAW